MDPSVSSTACLVSHWFEKHAKQNYWHWHFIGGIRSYLGERREQKIDEMSSDPYVHTQKKNTH